MKVLLFANTDWYLYNFRLSLALALREAGHQVLLTSPPGRYGDRLRDLGLEWVPAPMERGSLNPIREASLLLWLRGLIATQRIDLVHGFTIKCAVYGAIAARFSGTAARVAAIAGMGYVFTSNEAKARFLRPFVRTLMRLAFNGPRCRLILQNPDDVALLERACLVAPDIVRMIPGSGVNCDRFSIPPHRQPRGSRLRVLFAARLLWDKGISEFVAAAQMLLAEGRAMDFVIAGSPDPGNPAAVPAARVTEWVDEGLVQWLGHVDDMPALLKSVDIAVLPSYREGLPKGLIEAAACGLPIVTTDAPGCREVVTDGVDGLLVPVKDPTAIALAVARLHDDPQLRAKLGEAARKKTLAHFDERIIVNKTISVYRELVPAAAT